MAASALPTHMRSSSLERQVDVFFLRLPEDDEYYHDNRRRVRFYRAYNSGDTQRETGRGGYTVWPQEGDTAFQERPETSLDEPVSKRKEEPVVDPWLLTKIDVNEMHWDALSRCGRIRHVGWDYVLCPLLFLGLVYLFLASLDLMSTAMTLVAGRQVVSLLRRGVATANPVASIIVGMLAAMLLLDKVICNLIVTYMANAKLFSPRVCVFIVLGANVGVTLTAILVSFCQVSDRERRRRAFGAACLPHAISAFSAVILLPVEAATGVIYHVTTAIATSSGRPESHIDGAVSSPFSVVKPFTNLIVKVDMNVLRLIATGKGTVNSLLPQWCNDTVTTSSPSNVRRSSKQTTFAPSLNLHKSCAYLFKQLSYRSSDWLIGVLVLILASLLTCVLITLITRILRHILNGKIVLRVRRVVNKRLPGRMAWLTGYTVIVTGISVTLLIVRSDMLTAILAMLVGINFLLLERMFELSIGSNLGTTFAVLISVVTSPGHGSHQALQVALSDVFINIFVILMWYPLPITRMVVIRFGKYLGNTAATYCWFPVVYILINFIICPVAVFGLCLTGWTSFLVVGLIAVLLLLVIIILNIIQRMLPVILPVRLRTWEFLPEWLRSLSPVHRIILAIYNRTCRQCTRRQLITRQKQLPVTSRRPDDSNTRRSVPKKDSAAAASELGQRGRFYLFNRDVPSVHNSQTFGLNQSHSRSSSGVESGYDAAEPARGGRVRRVRFSDMPVIYRPSMAVFSANPPVRTTSGIHERDTGASRV